MERLARLNKTDERTIKRKQGKLKRMEGAMKLLERN